MKRRRVQSKRASIVSIPDAASIGVANSTLRRQLPFLQAFEDRWTRGVAENDERVGDSIHVRGIEDDACTTQRAASNENAWEHGPFHPTTVRHDKNIPVQKSILFPQPAIDTTTPCLPVEISASTPSDLPTSPRDAFATANNSLHPSSTPLETRPAVYVVEEYFSLPDLSTAPMNPPTAAPSRDLAALITSSTMSQHLNVRAIESYLHHHGRYGEAESLSLTAVVRAWSANDVRYLLLNQLICILKTPGMVRPICFQETNPDHIKALEHFIFPSGPINPMLMSFLAHLPLRITSQYASLDDCYRAHADWIRQCLDRIVQNWPPFRSQAALTHPLLVEDLVSVFYLDSPVLQDIAFKIVLRYMTNGPTPVPFTAFLPVLREVYLRDQKGYYELRHRRTFQERTVAYYMYTKAVDHLSALAQVAPMMHRAHIQLPHEILHFFTERPRSMGPWRPEPILASTNVQEVVQSQPGQSQLGMAFTGSTGGLLPHNVSFTLDASLRPQLQGSGSAPPTILQNPNQSSQRPASPRPSFQAPALSSRNNAGAFIGNQISSVINTHTALPTHMLPPRIPQQHRIPTPNQSYHLTPSHSQTTPPTLTPRVPQVPTSTTQDPRDPSVYLFPRDDEPRPGIPVTDISARTALHQALLRSPTLTPQTTPSQTLFRFISGFAFPPCKITPSSPSGTYLTITFTLSAANYARLAKPIPPVPTPTTAGAPANLSVSESSLLLRARCIAYPINSSPPTESAWVTANTYWPEDLFIAINDVFLDFRRKFHYGKDLPANVTHLLREGKNTLTISLLRLASDRPPNVDVALAIETVEFVSRETIVQQIPNLPSEVRLKSICAPLRCKSPLEKQSPLARPPVASPLPITTTTENPPPPASPTSSTSSLEITSTSLTISLCDPLTLRPITSLPVRGRLCTHNSCFDLETFLSSAGPQKSSGVVKPEFWRCPTCRADVRPKMLLVDGFLVKVMKGLKLKGNGEGEGGGARAVVVDQEGNWRVVGEERRGGGVDEDGVSGRVDGIDGEGEETEREEGEIDDDADVENHGVEMERGMREEDKGKEIAVDSPLVIMRIKPQE